MYIYKKELLDVDSFFMSNSLKQLVKYVNAINILKQYQPNKTVKVNLHDLTDNI